VPEPEDPPKWPRRRATAYHQAGHATVAIAAGVAVAEIAILDRMRAGGTRRCRDGHVRVAGVDRFLPSRHIMVLVVG
jgi:ATP-dependent Zn protease